MDTFVCLFASVAAVPHLLPPATERLGEGAAYADPETTAARLRVRARAALRHLNAAQRWLAGEATAGEGLEAALTTVDFSVMLLTLFAAHVADAREGAARSNHRLSAAARAWKSVLAVTLARGDTRFTDFLVRSGLWRAVPGHPDVCDVPWAVAEALAVGSTCYDTGRPLRRTRGLLCFTVAKEEAPRVKRRRLPPVQLVTLHKGYARVHLGRSSAPILKTALAVAVVCAAVDAARLYVLDSDRGTTPTRNALVDELGDAMLRKPRVKAPPRASPDEAEDDKAARPFPTAKSRDQPPCVQRMLGLLASGRDTLSYLPRTVLAAHLFGTEGCSKQTLRRVRDVREPAMGLYRETQAVERRAWHSDAKGIRARVKGTGMCYSCRSVASMTGRHGKASLCPVAGGGVKDLEDLVRVYAPDAPDGTAARVAAQPEAAARCGMLAAMAAGEAWEVRVWRPRDFTHIARGEAPGHTGDRMTVGVGVRESDW
jgi:hypothetical protein